jgi:hypothetical protein
MQKNSPFGSLEVKGRVSALTCRPARPFADSNSAFADVGNQSHEGLQRAGQQKLVKKEDRTAAC